MTAYLRLFSVNPQKFNLGMGIYKDDIKYCDLAHSTDCRLYKFWTLAYSNSYAYAPTHIGSDRGVSGFIGEGSS